MHTIPNADEAVFLAMSAPDSRDFQAMVAGTGGTGVISGGAVTPSSGMTVAVAAMTGAVNGAAVSYAGGTATLGNGDGANPRIDLITVTSAGAAAVIAGTPAENPEMPALPATSILLYAVWVPTGNTTVASTQLVDKRVFMFVPKVTTTSLATALTRTDPALVPILSGTNTPATANLLADVAACARSVGPSGAQLVLAVCDSSLGRQPHPTTQAEYTSPPAGISYYQVANLSPLTAQVYAARADGGASVETHAHRSIKITGLTPTHTLNWELLVGIVGAASDASPMDVNVSGRPAPIRHKGGADVWKVYQGADTSKRVDTTVFSAGIPGQVSTIRTGSASIANNPKDVVTNSKQSMLVFLCQTSSAIQVWDPIWDRSVAIYTPSVAPIRGDLTPDGSVLAFIGGTSLILMDTAAGTFGTAVSTTDTPVDVKFDPATSHIWVLTSNGKIRGWNYAGSGTTIGTSVGAAIAPGNNPSAPTASRFCISSDGTRAWFADDTNSKLTECNLSTLSVTRSITLPGAGPYVGCERFPGSNSTVMVVASAASTSQIQQVNVADWTIWVTWANKLNIPGATNANCVAGGLAISGDGCIFVSDTFNNGVNCWFGAAFEFDPSYYLTKDYLDVVLTELVV